MSLIDFGAHIQYLIEKELASRKAELERQKAIFNEGKISEEELKDYFDDVGNEEVVLARWMAGERP